MPPESGGCMFLWKPDNKLPDHAASSPPKVEAVCSSGNSVPNYKSMRPQAPPTAQAVCSSGKSVSIYPTMRLQAPSQKNNALCSFETLVPMYSTVHCVRRRKWRDNSPPETSYTSTGIKLFMTNEHAAIMFMSIVGAHKQGLHRALTVKIERSIFLRNNGALKPD
jgi:hypothetical protein